MPNNAAKFDGKNKDVFMHTFVRGSVGMLTSLMNVDVNRRSQWKKVVPVILFLIDRETEVPIG